MNRRVDNAELQIQLGMKAALQMPLNEGRYIIVLIRSIQAVHAFQSAIQLVGGKEVEKKIKKIGQYGEWFIDNIDAIDLFMAASDSPIDYVLDNAISKFTLLSTAWTAIKYNDIIKNELKEYDRIDYLITNINGVLKEYGVEVEGGNK